MFGLLRAHCFAIILERPLEKIIKMNEFQLYRN